MPDQLPLPSTELVHDSQGWGEEPEPEASPHLVAEVDIEASDGSSTPEPQASQEVEVVQVARNDEEDPSEQDTLTRLEPEELGQVMSIKSELENLALIVTTWVMQLESREHKRLIEDIIEKVVTLQIEIATLSSVVESVTTDHPYVRSREQTMKYLEDTYLNIRARYDELKPVVMEFLDAPARANLKRGFSSVDV